MNVSISTPEKILWPRLGFTRGALARYYDAIAPVLLPHVTGRPLTFVRAPQGVLGRWWYQTECPHPPPWLATAQVPAASGNRIWNYCVVDETRALRWLVNIGSIELHPLLAEQRDLTQTRAIVFDLDPGEGVGLTNCCEVALVLRDSLAARGLTVFVKVSGAAGVHVVAPLARGVPFDVTREFALTRARELVAAMPDRVTDQAPKRLRAGKVFVDWQQNGRFKSMAAPYSVRLLELPFVAVPLEWAEVHDAIRRGSGEQLRFLPDDAVARVSRGIDPWSSLWSTDQELR